MAPKKNDKTNKTSGQASDSPASSPPPKMDLSIDIAADHKSSKVSSFPLGPSASGSDLTNGISISLHGLTLDVIGGEKLGVVGRTGAGKSTILACLYRLTELRSGRIEIDGVDLARVPLPTLRSRIGIIPPGPAG